jgi:ComF family protein
MSAPEPVEAEFFCKECHTPFLTAFPLDDEGRCRLCASGERPFDGVYSLGAYQGRLRELIHLFKYAGIRSLAGPLGVWLAEACPRQQSYDAIVSVPLHWTRRWKRGFNQSEMLGAELQRHLGVRMLRLLRRRKATPSQAGSTAAARRRNLRGAFAVRAPEQVRGKSILLVDDVFTTGATAAAAAAALKRAGAAHVTVLTLARADRRADTVHIRTPRPQAAAGAAALEGIPG